MVLLDNRKRINGYNAFTFVKWIYLFGFNGIAFGWSQFEATDWAVVPTLVYWKIGCSGHPPPFITFKPNNYHERIETNDRCCFYLSQPLFATMYHWFRWNELSLVKIISALLIFVGVYGDVPAEGGRLNLKIRNEIGS
jgi:hypothetical protein